MNELQIKNKTIDSREVAEMVEKQHKNLLADIRTYVEYLENGELKIQPSNFFIESTYVNSQNKEQPNYQVTKKGCEFIAHKLTGQKGAVFTAKYINKFHELESATESNVYRLPSSYKEALQQLLIEVEEKEVLETKINELQPKATYCDLILQCNDLLSTSQIAKDYGKSAQWLNSLLCSLGVQYKQGGVWLIYQKKYGDRGYTQSKTYHYIDDEGTNHARPLTYWTQKGRLFIYELLKDNGYLPVMEKEYAEHAIQQRIESL